VNKTHATLGYLGLIPFLALAGFDIAGWQPAHFILLSYATLIASFLAGSLWMGSVTYTKHNSVAIASNIIMLAAWLALILNHNVISPLLAAALLAGVYVLERKQFREEYEAAYFRLRGALTGIAGGSMVLSAVF